MTAFVLSTPPAPKPEQWTAADVRWLRAAVVVAACVAAVWVGRLSVAGVDVVRWALPLLLIVTAVALSWRPKSPEGG